MKAEFKIRFATGYDLTDNDRYRIREHIIDYIQAVAEEYHAEVEVEIGYFVPGPFRAAGYPADYGRLPSMIPDRNNAGTATRRPGQRLRPSFSPFVRAPVRLKAGPDGRQA